MSLQEQLDRAIGEGPELPSAPERLVAARGVARRRRSMVAGTAAAAALAAAAVMMSPYEDASDARSPYGDVGPAATPEPAEPDVGAMRGSDGVDRVDESGLRVEVVDGLPELAGYPARLTIGPVMRSAQEGFGLDVQIDGNPSFVLLVRTDERAWRIHRVTTVPKGENLATWLRDDGWLPTGEPS
jgi:hypothetical protein